MRLANQSLFDGKGTWEAFIRPFESLAQGCGWDNEEKLFWLTNSLRVDAAEHAFCQLTPDIISSYQKLALALEARLQECHAVHHIPIGEPSPAGRCRQVSGEKLSEYIADLRRLREESNKLSNVRAVLKDEEYVTTGQLQKFGEEQKSSIIPSLWILSLMSSCHSSGRKVVLTSPGRSGTSPKFS